MNFTVIDIVVLEQIAMTPVAVSDPNFKVSGAKLFYELPGDDAVKESKIISVVNSLKNKALIKKSTFSDELEHLTKSELKELLVNTELPKSGSKSDLINSIIDFNNTHEYQIIDNTGKTFYKLTDNGLLVLEQYKNFIWVKKNFYQIFGTHQPYYKFNLRDFLDIPVDIDIKKFFIDKFKNDFYILSNIHFIWEEYKLSYFYLIDYFLEQLENEIEKTKNRTYPSRFYSDKYNFSNLLYYINIDNNDIDGKLRTTYGNLYNIKEMFTLTKYLDLVLPLVSGENHSYSRINEFLEELYQKIESSAESEAYEAISNIEEGYIQNLYSRLRELNLEMADIIEELGIIQKTEKFD